MCARKISGKSAIDSHLRVRYVELDTGYPESKLGSMQTTLVTHSFLSLLH